MPYNGPEGHDEAGDYRIPTMREPVVNRLDHRIAKVEAELNALRKARGTALSLVSASLEGNTNGKKLHERTSEPWHPGRS